MTTAEFIERMRAFRRAWLAKHGGKTFYDIPESWYEPVHYRCVNDHVSTTILKSEVKGDLCLACGAAVMITFPTDRDGPFPEAP